MTYTAETRQETTRTKGIMEIAEMEVLCKIMGKTSRNRERSRNVNEWVLKRKKEWDHPMTLMDCLRIVKIPRVRSLLWRRSPGKPRKR